VATQGILKGKYYCTVDLLFDWFLISCMTTDHFCFCLQNRLIQTSQTGGQQYSDTPLVFPDSNFKFGKIFPTNFQTGHTCTGTETAAVTAAGRRKKKVLEETEERLLTTSGESSRDQCYKTFLSFIYEFS